MNQQLKTPPSINLLNVLLGVWQRKLLISVITLLALVVGLAASFVLKPMYSTEAQILIENLSTPYDRVQSPDEQRPDAVDDRVIQSQMSVLKSRDLASRVVDALKLQERNEFDPLKAKPLGTIKQLLIKFGFSDDPRLMTPQQRALERYSDELVVYQVPLSNVIAIKYSASDPDTAAEVANTLAKTYVASTAESKSLPTVRARDWLGQQIEELRKKLAVSEALIEEFRTKSGLLKGENSTLGAQELSELNTQITLAGTARTEAQERAKSINNILATKGTVDASTDVLSSPTVQRLREQQAISASRVAELSATYLPNHPKMIAAQNDLRNIDLQIRSEALKVVEGLNQQAKIATAREASLRARLEEMKGSESTANLDDVKLQAMERDSAADKALLESLLLRYSDASARQDMTTQPGLGRIIQQAAVPTNPSSPNKGPLVILVTLAGFALSLGLSFLLEIMTAASRLTEQMSDASSPVMPLLDNMQPKLAIATPVARPQAISPLASFPSGASEQVNQELLASSLHQDAYGLLASAGQVADWAIRQRKGPAPRQLAILSLGGGATDSSLSVVVIARAIASKGARVVVVDLAEAGSSIDRLFGLPSGPGLIDLLAGTADFTKVIARDPLSEAHLLRFGHDRSEVSLSLMSQRSDAVVSTLGSIYDIVILHAGEAAAEIPALVGKCQSVLILAPPSRQVDVAKAAQTLLASGVGAVQYVKLEPWQPQGIKLAASA